MAGPPAVPAASRIWAAAAGTPVHAIAIGPAGDAQPPRLSYSAGMKTFLTVLIVLLMIATLAVLVAGMVGLVRGGGDPARSNRLMRWRVILQGAALLLFAILMTLLRS